MPAYQLKLLKNERFKRVLRRTVKTASIIIGILTVLWICVFLYFTTHKKEIREKAIAALQKNINGSLQVGEIGLYFPSTFPYVSLELENVIIHDSLYYQHKHELLQAKRILLQVNPLRLLTGLALSRIVVTNGTAYVFEDLSGYTSTAAFRKDSDNDKKKKLEILGVRLQNMHVVYDRRLRNKLYDLNIKKLDCDIKHIGDHDRYKIKTSMLVNALSFNLVKGSYVEHQSLSGNFSLQYDKKARILSFDDIVLYLAGDPYNFTGQFNLAARFFHLEVKAPKANFTKTVKLLPYSIRRNIDSIFFNKPLNANATVDGKLQPGYKATVRVNWAVKNTAINTPFGSFDNTSFTGFFFNKISDTLLAIGENSAIQINDFSMNSEGVNLHGKKAIVTNLKSPSLVCDLQATADLSKVNEVINSTTFHFNSGTATANLQFSGPLYDSATDAPNIRGAASISNASLLYGPRQIQLDDLNGELVFAGTDVYFKNVKALAQGNKIEMNVTGLNLLTLMNKDPSKAVLSATVSSPEIDISKFTSFVGKRASTQNKKNGKGFISRTSNRIDNLLDQCSIVSDISAAKIRFHNFLAEQLSTNITLTNSVWLIKKTSFKHAGGNVNLEGELKSGNTNYNPVSLQAKLSNLDIAKLFYAFNNFNLSSLHAKNLKGKLNSDIDISGALLDKATLAPASLKGTVSFSLQEGELNNFEPLEKMSIFLLKNRDFSHINFSEIHDRFDVDGSMVNINRMEIQSNVLQLFMEGLYDIKGEQTNLQIQVPLSNLKKRDPDYVPAKEGTKSKQGISVYVNAKSNTKGDIDFSYSLFRKKTQGEIK